MTLIPTLFSSESDYEIAAKAHIKRVLADGGIIDSKTLTKNYFKKKPNRKKYLVANKEILDNIISDLNASIGLPKNGTKTYGIPIKKENGNEYFIQIDNILFRHFKKSDLDNYGVYEL